MARVLTLCRVRPAETGAWLTEHGNGVASLGSNAVLWVCRKYDCLEVFHIILNLSLLDKRAVFSVGFIR